MNFGIKQGLVGFSGFLLSLILSMPSAVASSLVLPDWPQLFNPDGGLRDAVGPGGDGTDNGIADYIDLYAGTDAVFLGDNLSAGLATDMSVLSGSGFPSGAAVDNGTVPAQDDLGNAFVFTKHAAEELILSAAVERIGGPQNNTFVEFEFNQKLVRVRNGAPWPVHGKRTSGDILVRLEINNGLLAGMQVNRWQAGSGFQIIASYSTVDGQACQQSADHLMCDSALAGNGFTYTSNFDAWNESWDMSGLPVEPVRPNSLLEFSLNITRLTGAQPDFSSIVLRSPRDITLGTFRNMGYWASR